MRHLPIEWLFYGLTFGWGIFIGYWLGARHLLWANSSLEEENRNVRARLKLYERGWVPRDWKIPYGEMKEP